MLYFLLFVRFTIKNLHTLFGIAMKSRSTLLVEKSISAMLSAIEVYNKPTFEYREETFSILAINAWELLLKARILKLDKNRVSAIIVYTKKSRRNGEPTTKLYRKKNRSGNYNSIGLFTAYDRLTTKYKHPIDSLVKKNLEVLTEIRDNSVHFLNKSFEYKKKVYEVGTATIKNYIVLMRQWFGKSISNYDLFLMPLAFVNNAVSVVGLPVCNEEKNLLKLISKIEKSIKDTCTQDFNFTLDIDIQLKRSSSSDAAQVVQSNTPDAVPGVVSVAVTEEDIRRRYPWDYNMLTDKLRSRYSDFKQTQVYHKLRKSLEANKKYCNTRYLDPGNTKSAKKKLYNPNIITEFDKYYTRISITKQLK